MFFELSPLNELYRGKLVRSITLISFEIFLLYICIIGQGGVLHSRIVVLPCWTYKLSPLNELYRRKLVNLKVKMKSLQSAFHFCSQ